MKKNKYISLFILVLMACLLTMFTFAWGKGIVGPKALKYSEQDLNITVGDISATEETMLEITHTTENEPVSLLQPGKTNEITRAFNVKWLNKSSEKTCVPSEAKGKITMGMTGINSPGMFVEGLSGDLMNYITLFNVAISDGTSTVENGKSLGIDYCNKDGQNYLLHVSIRENLEQFEKEMIYSLSGKSLIFSITISIPDESIEDIV